MSGHYHMIKNIKNLFDEMVKGKQQENNRNTRC